MAGDSRKDAGKEKQNDGHIDLGQEPLESSCAIHPPLGPALSTCWMQPEVLSLPVGNKHQECTKFLSMAGLLAGQGHQRKDGVSLDGPCAPFPGIQVVLGGGNSRE